MVGRAVTNRAERRSEGSSLLPIFERLAPPASMADIAFQIEAWTKPGEVVLDLNGRGGWSHERPSPGSVAPRTSNPCR